MVEKEIALELARFLDSPRSRGAGAASARPVAEAFFRACYEDLGKRPHLLDGEDVALLMRELLPSRMGKGERLAEDVPAVLDGIVDHLEETGMLAQAFEVRSALAAGEGELVGTNFERKYRREGRPFFGMLLRKRG